MCVIEIEILSFDEFLCGETRDCVCDEMLTFETFSVVDRVCVL